MKGGVAEFSERPLAGIPFRRINWEDKQEVRLHDQIRAKFISLKSDSEGDRAQGTKVLHEMVYKLLGLPVSVKG
jgi:hypothetical protein